MRGPEEVSELGRSTGEDLAYSPAAFLAEADRRLSGALHTDRAVDLVLELLVGELADWAQVIVRSGRGYTSRFRLADGRPLAVALPALAVPTDGVLGRVLAHGSVELVPVHEDGDEHDPTLVSAVPSDEARRQVAAIRPVDVLTAPLTARGRTYGALTLARRAGDGFDTDAVTFAGQVAAHVSVALDSTLALAESRRVTAVLSRDLHPPTLPTLRGVALGSYYRVAMEQDALGGDFYDVHGEADDWTAVMGDVCGKGAEAAALTGRVRQAVRTAALVDRSPAFVLALVNRGLLADGEETFVTALCARGRPHHSGLRLDLAAAGHPHPWLVRRDGTVEQVATSGVALGLLDDPGYTDLRLDLTPGDTLVLYTDGVTEAPGHRARFGDDRLHEVLAGTRAVAPQVLVDAVAVALSRHVGERPHDDIALLALQAGTRP